MTKKVHLLLLVSLTVLLATSTVASAKETQVDSSIGQTKQTAASRDNSYAVVKNLKTNIIPEKYSQKIGTPKLIYVGGWDAVQVTCPKGTVFIVRDSKGNVVLKRKFKKSNMMKLVVFPKELNGKKVYMYAKSGNKRGKIIKHRLHYVPYIE